MAITLEQFGLDKLDSAERARLAELLWESVDCEVDETGEVIDPPAWRIEVLKQRMKAEAENPVIGIPVDEAMSSVLDRLS